MSNDRFNGDPELDDALQGDRELMRIARLLGSTRRPEPPLDDAFRASLRRRLMDQAWDAVEDRNRNAWWRGFFMPQRVAWAGAAAVLLIAASVVFYTTSQPGGGLQVNLPPKVGSPIDGTEVASVQAIPVRFDQPMDHRSTEAAVQVTPATAVTFSWSGDELLYVTPTSGNLAPNTQYQVTIGPGAKTLAGTQNPQPQTITFTTTAGPGIFASPSPSPSPTAPTSLLTNQHQLTADYPPSGTDYPVMWSADSSTVFFAGANGALESVTIAGGTTKTLVASGVSQPAIAPAGDRLAYVRAGKIEILDLSTGATTDIAINGSPTVLAWVKDRLYWGTTSAVYRLDGGAPVKLTDVSAASGAVISIAPDGRHAILQVADALEVVEIPSGKTANVCGGGCATTFQGWSPDGTRFVYNGNIADTNGTTVSSVPPADTSWSADGELLLGGDTGVFEIRPDGTEYVKLADGSYHQPQWAPDATTFVFVRGGALWVATAPPTRPEPPAIAQALNVVNAFMRARLNGEGDHAMNYLDANGKTAYAGPSPTLIPQGDPSFKRFYVLTSEIDPSNGSVHVVVRLVFKHGKVEQMATEEALTLVRAQDTDPYLIDAATAGPVLQFGKGPQVVAVKITATEISVTFDSDLVPTSITNVTLQDSQGTQIQVTPSYGDRTVTFSNLQLTAGAHYRLVVLPGVEDVGNHNAAAEYDLDLIGPATAGGVTTSPSPSPSPQVTPSPSPSPSQPA